MSSIPISDLLTIIFVMVDDWHQVHGSKLLAGKVGRKPILRDSEIITLVLAQDFIPYPAETQYVEFIRANYLRLFPKLVDQSQFNRRARLAIHARRTAALLAYPKRLALADQLLVGHQTCARTRLQTAQKSQ